MQINRMPRKGEKILFDSQGMFPNSDNKEYEVLGKASRPDILNIRSISDGSHSQIIVRFAEGEGWNKYLYFSKLI